MVDNDVPKIWKILCRLRRYTLKQLKMLSFERLTYLVNNNSTTRHLHKVWNGNANKLRWFPTFKRFLPWYESVGSLVSHYISRFLPFLRPWPQQQTAPPGRGRGMMSRTDTQDIHLTGQNECRLTAVCIGVVSRCGRFLAWTYLLLDEALLKVK